jgi:hypothetical protein
VFWMWEGLDQRFVIAPIATLLVVKQKMQWSGGKFVGGMFRNQSNK